MKSRGLIVAAVLFFILAGVLYWSEHHKPAADAAKTSSDTPPVILKLDESAITKLEIKRKDVAPLALAKGDSGKWQITGPRPLGADETAVSGMVSTISSLNSERLVDDKASDLKQYGLDQPVFELDITEKNNKTQKLLMGDDTPTSGAVYVMLKGDPRVFSVPKTVKASVDKSLNEVRDKRLLTANADKISRLELVVKSKAQDIEFGRNKDDWQILKPKPLRADSVLVAELARKLSETKMDLGAADNGDIAREFALAIPVATAKVTDESGTQELEVRKSTAGKDKGNFYAKSSAVEGAYKIEAELGQALDKGLDDFRNKKVFDFSYSDPNKVELHDGSKAYFLTRNGDDWWSNGKKMDTSTVQSLVSKLRDLSAQKFLESGFGNPTIEITVTYGEGKQVEKVSAAKSGDSYVAKRENEPALYQLSSGSVDDLKKSADEIKPAAAPSK